MVYDKYRTWPLPGRRGAISMKPHSSLEEQVLKDLDEVKDEVDKLEILDSFAAYTQRAYRRDFAEAAADITGRQLGDLLAPIFLSRLPEVYVYGRPRVGKLD